MAGIPPGSGTVKLEYTVGSKAEFPTQASVSATNQAVIGVGTAFPANPYIGMPFYRSDLAHLYVWTGKVWGPS